MISLKGTTPVSDSGGGGGGGGRVFNGSSRQRAQQAVDYYNSHLLKGRPRAPYNRQASSPTKALGRLLSPQDALYRSNSSLELVHDSYGSSVEGALRREYGSHGSIDVIGSGPSTGESFFAMLQDYRPVVLPADQRSPGPAEYLRHRLDPPTAPPPDAANALTDETDGRGNTSPKLKVKLAKLWGRDGKPLRNGNVNGLEEKQDAVDEERRRRRAFAHFDCQSLSANLSYAAKLRGMLLARRRNTATGASAASMAARAETPHAASDSPDDDHGDGNCNDLVESCPFFRNEVGGEEERVVSLTRVTQRKPSHGPPLSVGLSVLEFPPGETHWGPDVGTCPYAPRPAPSAIEGVDHGALYYRSHFYGQEHQNWFGMDDNLGPVAISIKKEKAASAGSAATSSTAETPVQYRLIVRTSELLTLRGTVMEESIPNLKPSGNLKTYNTKEVLESITPEISLLSLRQATSGSPTEEQLLKLDEQGLSKQYKVGVLYCRAGQSLEEEMYNNEDAGPALLEFLDTIGQRVRLRGFDKYRAGLDNKTDSTGLYSVYAQHGECELMFHVSTMLPYTATNRQQLLRKRHIGNDIVTIVFQEPGALPFTPRHIRSQFQHVFIVVRAHNPCSDHTHYSVAVTRSKEVPVFGPPIPESATFPRGRPFADFLLAKLINAETAAHRSVKFSTMATRTRQEYLKDLASNYVTSTLVEPTQKFSMLSFSSKKKERTRQGRWGADESLRGALCWPVVVEDAGQSQLLDCVLGISADSIVLVEEASHQLVFVTPCQSVLGWSIQTSSVSLYHHQGECVTVHTRDGGERGERDDLLEVVLRLKAVTRGCGAQELSLKRNPQGQLGFHVQPDGIVTQVEPHGQAWTAGLRQGCRLVEICKVAVSTLTHDQMVDLLKTSVSVCVTVIEPQHDGSPRRGCSLSNNCTYTLCNYEGDYENLHATESPTKTGSKKATVASLQPSGQRKKYERSFSPPRSSNSSGYGTGSSSKSFDHDKFHQGSAAVRGDERWYEDRDMGDLPRESPPPLPARAPPYASAGQTSGVLQLARKWEAGKLTAHTKLPSHAVGNSHGKLQSSQSLPLHSTGLSLPPTPSATHLNSRCDDVVEQNFKVGERVTALKAAGDRDALLPGRSGRGGDISLPVDYLRESRDAGSDNNSVASDRIFSSRSEDELSTGSGSNSPHGRRGRVALSSNGSPRNNSPRLTNGEARLRPGVTARNGGSNRHSANLTTSTLQEDLMKLINPDYKDSEEVTSSESSYATQENTPSMVYKPSISNGHLEGRKSDAGVAGGSEKTSHVILTTARPATVISNPSTTTSPAPTDLKLSKEERLSPRARVTKYHGSKSKSTEPASLPIPLPGPGEVDWPSLVDTATRAMTSDEESWSGGGSGVPGTDLHTEASLHGTNLGQWVDDVVGHLGLDTGQQQERQMSSLQSTVSHLESRVSRETRRRLGVEEEMRRLREEVRSLRDDNRRLQDESQAAAQQLRRFTEWFFQTIDRQ